MNTSKLSGPVAILMLPNTNGAFITFAKAVHDAIKNNPNFPKLDAEVDELEADTAAYEDAETKAASKTKGTAALRNAKKKKVIDDLRHLRDGVQRVVEAQASPADAAATIESAFMRVRKSASRSKAELSVRNKGTPGTVILVAKAEIRPATYYWEYSLDQASWTSVPETMKASTVIEGLSKAHTYAFRFRALTPKGPRKYSQVVTFLVH